MTNSTLHHKINLRKMLIGIEVKKWTNDESGKANAALFVNHIIKGL